MSQLSYKEIIENQLPENLFKSKDIESQAIGNSLDRLQYDIDMLENEVNPLTGKGKGLEQWEKFFKLPSNINDNIEVRKARVISELIQFMSDENVIRKDEMEAILSFFGDVEIAEHFAEYIFDVTLRATGEKNNSMNLNEVHKIIKKIKPAWLDYNLLIVLKSKLSEIYIATTFVSGENITVYPYSPKELLSKGNIYIATGSNTGLEKVIIYPRKEVI